MLMPQQKKILKQTPPAIHQASTVLYPRLIFLETAKDDIKFITKGCYGQENSEFVGFAFVTFEPEIF